MPDASSAPTAPAEPDRRVHTPLDYTCDADLASIRVIACDMDFTLLADDKSQPDGMPERIAALRDAGVVFCPASGRPGPTLELMFPEHAGDMAFCADNGGCVTYRGEVVYQSLIESALYRTAIKLALDEGSGVPVICALDGAYVPSWAREHLDALHEYYRTIIFVDQLEEVEVATDKITIYLPRQNSDQAFRAIAPRLDERLFITRAGVEWIDIMNHGVNKGAGLAHLCAHLGVSLADAAAVGDADNDTEMLEAAGHSFIVANAEARMRAHARYMIPSNNDRGVAVLLDAILAAKRTGTGAR